MPIFERYLPQVTLSTPSREAVAPPVSFFGTGGKPACLFVGAGAMFAFPETFCLPART